MTIHLKTVVIDLCTDLTPYMVLTYQTDEHDFYCQDPRFCYVGRYWKLLPARIYNIVPKGAEVPSSGYMQPAYIMKIKGYEHLTVCECFEYYFRTNK